SHHPALQYLPSESAPMKPLSDPDLEDVRKIEQIPVKDRRNDQHMVMIRYHQGVREYLLSRVLQARYQLVGVLGSNPKPWRSTRRAHPLRNASTRLHTA